MLRSTTVKARLPALILAALGTGCGGEEVIQHGALEGSGYFRRWSAGPPSDPEFFPIGVWLQDPAHAREYRAIGVNLFLGLHEGPTDRQLAELRSAGALGIAAQTTLGLDRRADRSIVSWNQETGPDNAQLQPGGGYGPCVDPSVIQASYDKMRTTDPTRPVTLMLGQGVANDRWVGRGPCTGKVEMYPAYARGGDILTFHIYPVNSDEAAVRGKLGLIGRGVERLRAAAEHRKPVWPLIETTAIDDPAQKPTPAQIKAQVWIALVHGATGIGYYAHVMKPRFVEAGLLADPINRTAVAAINQQIGLLAPVLNGPTLSHSVTVTTNDPALPVAVLAKRGQDATYLFAVGMADGTSQASFALNGIENGTVEVLGEDRRLSVAGGTFKDAFGPWAVHLYRVTR